MADDFISYDSLTGTKPASDEGLVSYDSLVKPAKAPEGDILSLPKDVAELGARGIDYLAQKIGATPRQSQPFSWQKKAGEGLPSAQALGHAAVEEAKGMAEPFLLPGQVYKGEVDPTSEEGIQKTLGLGLTAALSSPRAIPLVGPKVPAPLTRPLVTLSEGQATGNLPAIKREQAALRAQAGEPLYEHARAFSEQQAGEVEAYRTKIAADLDQLGQQIIAETPQEAGQLVSTGAKQARDIAKGLVDQAYEEARARPGEIHAVAFEGMPQQIKGDLTISADPVVIDNRITPAASGMIDYLDNQIGNLHIQNKADPFGQPSPERIVGVSLKGVDQWRKNLSAIRRGAATNEDRRAAGRVMNEFDNRVDAAINKGLFTGDPDAVAAWNAARAAHADYRSAFTQQGARDPVGNVVEKILGRGLQDPATPNDVMNFITGAPGTSPNSLNVAVTKRLKSTLGENSPEWIGVKQGIFQKLTERPEGMADFSPGVVANRLGEFLNGKGKSLAAQVYAPHEVEALRAFMELNNKLKVPQAGASNNSSPMVTAVKGTIKWIGAALGYAMAPGTMVGEAIGAGVGYTATQLGEHIAQRAALKRLTKQMPLIATQMQQWQRAAVAAQRAPAMAPRLEQASRTLATTLADLVGQPSPTMAPGFDTQKTEPSYKHGGSTMPYRYDTGGTLPGQQPQQQPTQSQQPAQQAPASTQTSTTAPAAPTWAPNPAFPIGKGGSPSQAGPATDYALDPNLYTNPYSGDLGDPNAGLTSMGTPASYAAGMQLLTSPNAMGWQNYNWNVPGVSSLNDFLTQFPSLAPLFEPGFVPPTPSGGSAAAPAAAVPAAAATPAAAAAATPAAAGVTNNFPVGLGGIPSLAGAATDYPLDPNVYVNPYSGDLGNPNAGLTSLGTPASYAAAMQYLTSPNAKGWQNYNWNVPGVSSLQDFLTQFPTLAPLYMPGFKMPTATPTSLFGGMARGGAVPKKVSKESVDYGEGMPARHCGVCRFFHGSHGEAGKCDKVTGIVHSDMWCRLWRKR